MDVAQKVHGNKLFFLEHVKIKKSGILVDNNEIEYEEEDGIKVKNKESKMKKEKVLKIIKSR